MLAQHKSAIGSVQEISLDKLQIGKSQMRTDPGKGIDELAQSIAKKGLIEPIVVKPLPDGKYEIIAGQRRFLAHQSLGYGTIQA